jgi:hypothetical protein
MEFMQQGTTTTPQVYCEKKLRRAIQNKARAMLTSDWSMLTGSCITTLLTALISLRVTTIFLLVPA